MKDPDRRAGRLGGCPGLLMGAAALYRIRVEEAALAQAFGADYHAYARGRWRLFPGL